MTTNSNDFFQMVYDVVRLIPKGRVTSFGAIARYIGAARSARMVGWALNVSHKQKDVPAHRVLNRNGELSGKIHFGAPDEMELRLKREGIKIIDNRVADLEKIFWDPAKELEL